MGALCLRAASAASKKLQSALHTRYASCENDDSVRVALTNKHVAFQFSVLKKLPQL